MIDQSDMKDLLRDPMFFLSAAMNGLMVQDAESIEETIVPGLVEVVFVGGARIPHWRSV